MSESVERKEALLSTKKQLQFQLNCFENSLNDDPADVAAIQARCIDSQKMLPQFIKISYDLREIDSSLCDDEELVSFEKQFYKTIATARAMSSALNPEKATMSNLTPTCINLKIPDLQKFSGENYEDWPAFYQMFKSLVHGNTNISPIMKFHYLKGAVVGKASELIKNIEFSEPNYSVALQALVDRYENKKKFVQRHMQILFKLGDIPYSGIKLTAKHLESIYNQTKQTLQSLEAAGIDTTSWDPFITHAIISKFDETTLAEWEEIAPPKDIPTRQQIFDFLIKRQGVMESLEIKLNKPPKMFTKYQDYSKTHLKPQKRKPTTFAMWEKEENPKVRKFDRKKILIKRCAYCNSINHQITECLNFKKLTFPDRALVVKSNNLCYQCLKGHQGICKNIPCRVCSGRHHQLLHQTKANPSQEESTESSQI